MSGDGEVVQEKSKKSETPPGFVEITEGRAKILFPSSNEVFYNPVQEFNRDLRYVAEPASNVCGCNWP